MDREHDKKKLKRVCIIGAGTAGLTAIKACLEEEGLEPVCFERSGDIGGLWRFVPEVDGKACVMHSTVTNTSKEMMAFSDFPPPPDFANYMHNSCVMEYLRLYAEHFKLLPYVQLNEEVLHVTRANDFDKTGGWTVKHRKVGATSDDAIVEECFHAVFVCVGHHSQPYKPTFKALDQFGGLVMHSHDYRDIGCNLFNNKKVLIIGIGNSGVDLAVEVSRVTKKTFLSTRRGSWIINRVQDGGLPIDVKNRRRWLYIITRWFPSIYDIFLSRTCNKRFDHALYGLKPDFRPSQQHPTVNDDLPNRIISGTVVIKGDVREFGTNYVIFEDGSQEVIDVVLLATGYRFNFSFLNADVLRVENNRLPLFKYMYSPNLPHGTLAFIGYVQPVGALHNICEQQCRWAVRVVKGLQALPSRSVMEDDIASKENVMAKRYVASPRHTIQVDWLSYMDELTSQFGARPSFVRLWLSRPRLAWKLFFGPSLPYQYRLYGPHTWPDAEKTIFSAWQRITQPLATRSIKESPKKACSFWCKALFFGCLVIFLSLVCQFV